MPCSVKDYIEREKKINRCFHSCWLPRTFNEVTPRSCRVCVKCKEIASMFTNREEFTVDIIIGNVDDASVNLLPSKLTFSTVGTRGSLKLARIFDGYQQVEGYSGLSEFSNHMLLIIQLKYYFFA